MKLSAAGLTLLMGLVLACGGEDTNGNTIAPAVDTLRVLGGPAVCDSCDAFTLVVAGQGAGDASGAAFVSRTAPARVLDATATLERFAVADTTRLRMRVVFAAEVPVGEYDLRLQTIDDAGHPVERTLSRALRVTRAWRPFPLPPDYGQLEVLVSVQGADPDSFFVARVQEGILGFIRSVVPGTPVAFRVQAGTRRVVLDEVAPNCTGPGTLEADVPIVAGTTSRVEFEVSCVPFAVVLVTAALTGEPEGGVTVNCGDDKCVGGTVSSNGEPLRLRSMPGLVDLYASPPSNCTLAGAIPVPVTFSATDTVRVEFRGSCVEVRGTVRLTLRTTGAAPNESFPVVIGYPGCAPYDCDEGLSLRPDQPQAIRVWPGPTETFVYRSPSNCVVTGLNPAVVDVVAGGTYDVVIEATCS